jgi:hypothetical protein
LYLPGLELEETGYEFDGYEEMGPINGSVVHWISGNGDFVGRFWLHREPECSQSQANGY